MSENLRESQEPPGARIRRNLVNIGFFWLKYYCWSLRDRRRYAFSCR